MSIRNLLQLVSLGLVAVFSIESRGHSNTTTNVSPFAITNDFEDPNRLSVLYTGSSGLIDGLKFYEFDNVLRTHTDAINFCKSKNLRLMNRNEALSLKRELDLDPQKKKVWHKGDLFYTTWIEELIVDPDAPELIPNSAQTITAYRGEDDTFIDVNERPGTDWFVRCVGR